MAANSPKLHVFVTAVAKEIHRNVELELHAIKKNKSKHHIELKYLFHHLFYTKQKLWTFQEAFKNKEKQKDC